MNIKSNLIILSKNTKLEKIAKIIISILNKIGNKCLRFDATENKPNTNIIIIKNLNLKKFVIAYIV